MSTRLSQEQYTKIRMGDLSPLATMVSPSVPGGAPASSYIANPHGDSLMSQVWGWGPPHVWAIIERLEAIGVSFSELGDLSLGGVDRLARADWSTWSEAEIQARWTGWLSRGGTILDRGTERRQGVFTTLANHHAEDLGNVLAWTKTAMTQSVCAEILAAKNPIAACAALRLSAPDRWQEWIQQVGPTALMQQLVTGYKSYVTVELDRSKRAINEGLTTRQQLQTLLGDLVAAGADGWASQNAPGIGAEKHPWGAWWSLLDPPKISVSGQWSQVEIKKIMTQWESFWEGFVGVQLDRALVQATPSALSRGIWVAHALKDPARVMAWALASASSIPATEVSDWPVSWPRLVNDLIFGNPGNPATSLILAHQLSLPQLTENGLPLNLQTQANYPVVQEATAQLKAAQRLRALESAPVPRSSRPRARS